jgi:Peptide N-acetyl-beta-D-glucosaminyl asparaginase amidase A
MRPLLRFDVFAPCSIATILQVRWAHWEFAVSRKDRFVEPRLCARLALLGLTGFCATLLAGDGGGYGTLPAIGSSNVASADPLVARPSTTPCEVTLLDNVEFNDYNPRDFDFTPPAACAGPWAKVVLSFDLSVTAGVQYDRTAILWIGGVNIFFGTTAEPASNRAPSWHVERDLTDYSALFATTQAGRAFIGNIVNSTYTGIIYGTAKLQFYPVSASDPAPPVPDQTLALGSDPVGATVDLSAATDLLSKSLTLPTNIERVYLDVVAESQGSDEFWWSCMPDDVAAITGDCPGTAFREVELAVDGQPAGVAPVYPWVYTGGVQPALWVPIAGLQTLNFKPYRVDLTPFAGVLSDGTAHTITLGVFNVHEHFSTTATLLLHLDAGATQVTGAVTTNTLAAAPTPVVTSTIGNSGLGTVTVDSNRGFTLAGYVQTSHGRIDTSIDQTLTFDTTTTYTSTQEILTQSTTVDATTTTADESIASQTVQHEQLSYPFAFTYSNAAIDFDQQLNRTSTVTVDGAQTFKSTLGNHVATHHQGAAASRHSEQDYEYSDSTGDCYSRDITSAANKLATVTDAAPCLIAADTIFKNGFDDAN